jgi:geranylgeranyl diphosphate synthase type I
VTSATWDPSEFQERLQSTLGAFVDDRGRALEPLGPDAALLVQAARDAVRGGKRFRAMFCYWGFRAVRDPDPDEDEALVRAAGALELLHASALVHDDYMDASDTRRGRPSVHRAFAARHRAEGWRGDPEQYGAAAAILLGDLLLSWADEQLRTCGFGPPQVLDALRYFDTTRSEVIGGQFLDVSVQARGAADVEQSMRVLRYKSAKYSVERPLHVGAALAGGATEVMDTLTAYGVPLGEAFQLRDDLLGVFGDPEVTGKPAGDDLTEGKRTVLVALALEALHGTDPEGSKLLDDSLGQPLDGKEVAELQRIIVRSGAQARVEERIDELMHRSLSALDGSGVVADSQSTLRGLAAAATQRVV